LSERFSTPRRKKVVWTAGRIERNDCNRSALNETKMMTNRIDLAMLNESRLTETDCPSTANYQN